MSSVLREIQLKHRRLAIVLIDIIGSTAFVQRHGAVKSARHFQYHDRLTRNLCYKFNGREIDRSDGFLMSFEGVVDAVNFALHYQRSVPSKTGLKARVGIHWGEVVEVQQSEVYIGVGAKKVELEGLAKNIAARTMSLCEEGQVLLTSEAMDMARNRTNKQTPPGTRYVSVGHYRFKGVRKPQQIFAVGETIHSLRPPKGGDKAKKVRGPSKTKYRYKDMTRADWLRYLYARGSLLGFLFLIWVFYFMLGSPIGRYILGLPHDFYLIEDLNLFIAEMWSHIRRFLIKYS